MAAAPEVSAAWDCSLDSAAADLTSEVYQTDHSLPLGFCMRPEPTRKDRYMRVGYSVRKHRGLCRHLQIRSDLR